MYSSETTRLIKSEGIPLIQFNILSQTGIVNHAFSTREGGVSHGTYSSMNLAFTRGDNLENVAENFRLMGKALHTDPSDMVLSHQTHTANVRIITDQDRGKGIVKDQDYKDVDGMITNIPGIMLVTSHADCVPLYFVDPVNKVIGLSHSGWKGTAAHIGAVTVSKMHAIYGCQPENILAAIGPCICKSCYEIGEDVAVEFRKTFTDGQAERILYPKENGKYMLDLKEANRIILTESGIKEGHLAIADICTSCSGDLLWSHRKTKGQRGGMCAFMSLI